MAKEGILLETGTNEVEVLEFVLGGQSFGVNVLKIQAIEQYDPARVTSIQLAHPSVIGTLLFRENCITLIDLSQEMSRDFDVQVDIPEITETENIANIVAEEMESEAKQQELAQASNSVAAEEGKRLVLVMEFNDLKTSFVVDGVNRIHRVSWEDISPLSPYLTSNDSKFTGSLQIDGREILIVDLEKIVADILPNEQLTNQVIADETNPYFHRRAEMHIFLAEDSALIRSKVTSELANGNYVNLKTFSNGEDCYKQIQKLAEKSKTEDRPISDYLAAVISDIEMPQMDGLTLCRNVKENPRLADLPVIIFSSLINDQIALKCRDVQSNAYISKPQFSELVKLLDKFCFEKQPV